MKYRYSDEGTFGETLLAVFMGEGGDILAWWSGNRTNVRQNKEGKNSPECNGAERE
jgi:hypothetical protein